MKYGIYNNPVSRYTVNYIIRKSLHPDKAIFLTVIRVMKWIGLNPLGALFELIEEFSAQISLLLIVPGKSSLDICFCLF